MAMAVRRILSADGRAERVIAPMGACASTGGMYRSLRFCIGVDKISPGRCLRRWLSAAAGGAA